jgi:hypothetical protein
VVWKRYLTNEEHAQSMLKYVVGFEVLTAVSMKMAVFWVVAQCSLVEVYQHFRVLATLIMEAARTSEMLINFYQTTWHYNPEDSHLLKYWLYPA